MFGRLLTDDAPQDLHVATVHAAPHVVGSVRHRQLQHTHIHTLSLTLSYEDAMPSEEDALRWRGWMSVGKCRGAVYACMYVCVHVWA